jgi:hypothetical protein
MFRLAGGLSLSSYRREWLARDVMAGVVLGTLLVPQGMAYAERRGHPFEGSRASARDWDPGAGHVPVVAGDVPGMYRRMRWNVLSELSRLVRGGAPAPMFVPEVS